MAADGRGLRHSVSRHSRWRRIARDALYGACELGWIAFFTVWCALLRPRPAHWTPTGKEPVLVVAPHPDDETLGCGGTIARHLDSGDSVCVLIATDGGRSRAGGYGSDKIVALRREEAKAAVAELGPARLVQLGLPEGAWKTGQLVDPLRDLLHSLRPTLVYSTSPMDYHPEHLRVCMALADALELEQSHEVAAIRMYEVQVPLGPVLVNMAVDIGPMEGRKQGALAAYKSQAAGINWAQRKERYLRALYGTRAPIEVFWEVTPSQFHRLAAQSLSAVGRPSFRGLRHRPFTDGLAWVVGWRERRRLKTIALEPASGDGKPPLDVV
jgi:LmbE family N-acetylglucosaminyl deacetylase